MRKERSFRGCHCHVHSAREHPNLSRTSCSQGRSAWAASRAQCLGRGGRFAAGAVVHRPSLVRQRSATSGRTIDQQTGTSMTGFRVLPPSADGDSRGLSLRSGRTRSCGSGRHRTRAVRPQFDRPNWNCPPSAVLLCIGVSASAASLAVIGARPSLQPHTAPFVPLGRPQCADFASQAFTPGCSPTARYRRRSFGQ